ncbi:MAG: NAD-dependent epimerase/dehydratase family protein [Bacillaceae bacterium]
MKKVLILGASGLVGKAIIEECKDAFDLYGTYCSSSTTLPNNKQFQLDIQQIDKGKELLRSIKPDIVISCLRGNYCLFSKLKKIAL